MDESQVRSRVKMNDTKKSKIDQEQPETVDEHFKLIVEDQSFISSEHRNVTTDDLPDWLDIKLFEIGQNYYLRNIMGLSGAYLAGLCAVLLIPSINKILVNTGQSSTPCTAFKRYLETLLHIYHLHLHNFRDSNSRFYKSLNTVNWKHSMNSKRAMRATGKGILQRDMVYTQFGFIGYVLISPDVLALTNEPIEREGINHFWRVMGRLLGIPDRLNICRKNEYETTLLCNKIRDDVYMKYLRDPSDEFFVLAYAAVSGLQCVDVMLDSDAFLEYFYEINSCKRNKQMNLYSKYNFLYRKCMFYLMKKPIIGDILRTFWNYYFRACYWVQERYPIVAWIRFGREKSKIVLYPPLT